MVVGGRTMRTDSISTARAAAAGDTDTVSAANSAGEITWMSGNSVSWNVFPAIGDDHPGPANHRGRHDVLVIGNRQGERTLKRLPTGHQRIVEVLAHRPDQPCTGRLRGRRKVSASFELGGLVELEFVENHLRPQRPIQTLDRHREQEIPLQARPENTRVENCREHPGSLSTNWPKLVVDAAGASPLRDRLPCVLQRLRDHRRIVLVVDPHSRLGECLVLAGPALLLILKHIPQQQPMPSADLLRRQLHRIDQPAHRRPAHPQQIRGLLRRQHHRPRCHRHRATGLQCGHDLLERRMHLRRQLHLIVLTGTDQQIPRLVPVAAAPLMGVEEADHRRQPRTHRCLRQIRVLIQRLCTRDRPFRSK